MSKIILGSDAKLFVDGVEIKLTSGEIEFTDKTHEDVVDVSARQQPKNRSGHITVTITHPKNFNRLWWRFYFLSRLQWLKWFLIERLWCVITSCDLVNNECNRCSLVTMTDEEKDLLDRWENMNKL